MSLLAPSYIPDAVVDFGGGAAYEYIGDKSENILMPRKKKDENNKIHTIVFLYILSFFLMCFVGEWILRCIYYFIFPTWPEIDFNINDVFAPVFFYATGAWLLCAVYRINGWDTGRKKKK